MNFKSQPHWRGLRGSAPAPKKAGLRPPASVAERTLSLAAGMREGAATGAAAPAAAQLELPP